MYRHIILAALVPFLFLCNFASGIVVQCNFGFEFFCNGKPKYNYRNVNKLYTCGSMSIGVQDCVTQTLGFDSDGCINVVYGCQTSRNKFPTGVCGYRKAEFSNKYRCCDGYTVSNCNSLDSYKTIPFFASPSGTDKSSVAPPVEMSMLPLYTTLALLAPQW